jgi:hypothetical protein
MKTKSIIKSLFVAAALVQTASAITVNVGRGGSSNPGVTVTSSTGLLSGGGYYIAVGTFSSFNATTSTWQDAPPLITGDFSTVLAAVD